MFLLAGLAAVGGCSSTGGGLVVPMPDADLTPVTTSPDGTPYPTQDVGGQPRSASRPGQTFPNLTLAGIRSAATSDELAVVSMSEYYTPACGCYALLHVLGIYFWCPHCNNETKALAASAEWLAAHRVAVVQIAMEGYGGASPGWNELQKWVRDHDVGFPVVVDGEGAELRQYFPVDRVPLNIVVDPRTMEILAVDVGEVTDVQAYEQKFLDVL